VTALKFLRHDCELCVGISLVAYITDYLQYVGHVTDPTLAD